jgi:hypothetical protein
MAEAASLASFGRCSHRFMSCFSLLFSHFLIEGAGYSALSADAHAYLCAWLRVVCVYSFRSPFFEIDSGYGKLVMQKVWKGACRNRGWAGTWVARWVGGYRI